MKPHLTATSFEALARERVAEFAPETDLDILGATFDLVRCSNQLVNDLETNVHRRLGWSWAGFRIMFTVLVTGPLEPGQIARLAGVTRASISAVLNTLERDGFVTRVRKSHDRRVVTIVLTDHGASRRDRGVPTPTQDRASLDASADRDPRARSTRRCGDCSRSARRSPRRRPMTRGDEVGSGA